MNVSKKAQKRHDEIKLLLSKKDIVTVQEFVNELKVSEATIRNDLAYLEDRNELKRILGGAISNEQTLQNTSFKIRKSLSSHEKEKIADYVVKNYIKPHMVIGLDAGTTCLAIAEKLAHSDIQCTVVTYSFSAAQALQKNTQIQVYLAAGLLDYEHDSFHDENTIRMMSTMKTDLFFLSCNGIDEKGSISSSATSENIIKEIMLENSNQCIVLCTHEKLSKRTIKHLVNVNEIDNVVVDYTDESKKWIDQNGIENITWVK